MLHSFLAWNLISMTLCACYNSGKAHLTSAVVVTFILQLTHFTRLLILCLHSHDRLCRNPFIAVFHLWLWWFYLIFLTDVQSIFTDLDKVQLPNAESHADDDKSSKSKHEVEFQYYGRLFSKTGSSYISAMHWDIWSKFGMQAVLASLMWDVIKLETWRFATIWSPSWKIYIASQLCRWSSNLDNIFVFEMTYVCIIAATFGIAWQQLQCQQQVGKSVTARKSGDCSCVLHYNACMLIALLYMHVNSPYEQISNSTN